MNVLIQTTHVILEVTFGLAALGGTRPVGMFWSSAVDKLTLRTQGEINVKKDDNCNTVNAMQLQSCRGHKTRYHNSL